MKGPRLGEGGWSAFGTVSCARIHLMARRPRVIVGPPSEASYSCRHCDVAVLLVVVVKVGTVCGVRACVRSFVQGRASRED